MFKISLKEEYDKLINEKITLIVMFLIPIAVVFLMGIEFSKESITEVPMAVIDYDNTSFSRMLISSFADNEIFDVVSYPESEEELEKMMRNSDVHVGIIIPDGFYNDVVNLESPSVMMLYDGANMAITSATKTKAMEILLTYKAGATISQLQTRLSLNYDEAYNITQAFQFKSSTFYNASKSYEDFLTPILMAGLVQSAIILLASVSINHDIFKYDNRKRMGYATGKLVFYSLLGTLSFVVCIVIQVYIFDVTFTGKIIDAMLLSLALASAVSGFCIIVSTVIGNRMVALIGCGIIFIPNSIMAGTTWPLFSMPSGYRSFSEFIPLTHYINNLREIYMKGSSLTDIKEDILYMFVFALISILISELTIAIKTKTNSEEGELIGV